MLILQQEAHIALVNHLLFVAKQGYNVMFRLRREFETFVFQLSNAVRGNLDTGV